jgi:hypothetical protein
MGLRHQVSGDQAGVSGYGGHSDAPRQHVIEVRIFPGVRHGYMMHSNEAVFFAVRPRSVHGLRSKDS